MTFWKHILLGYLVLLVPFFGSFLISIFTPWDVFSPVQDYALVVVPLVGLIRIAAFFLRKSHRPTAEIQK